MNAAVAGTMAIGNIRLRNVGMMVLPDSAPPMSFLPPGERGVLGLPVILALRTLRWQRGGMFEAGFPSKGAGEPNLSFDGFSVLTQVGFGGREIDFVLDTGDGAGTQLWTKFGEVFPGLIREQGSKGTNTVTQVGGSKNREITILPELRLRLGGLETLLRPAYLYSKPVGNDLSYGLAGMDLMMQAREVTIDFARMRLELRN